MKNQDIIGLTNKELVVSLREERTNLQKMKLHNAVSQIESPQKLKETRKTIARILSEINKRRITAEEAAFDRMLEEDNSAK